MNDQTNADMLAELARLRAENRALAEAAASGLKLKVSEKGAVSVYGMGRFPVTLYAEQWHRVFIAKAQIMNFISDNKHLLKHKAED